LSDCFQSFAFAMQKISEIPILPYEPGYAQHTENISHIVFSDITILPYEQGYSQNIENLTDTVFNGESKQELWKAILDFLNNIDGDDQISYLIHVVDILRHNISVVDKSIILLRACANILGDEEAVHAVSLIPTTVPNIKENYCLIKNELDAIVSDIPKRGAAYKYDFTSILVTLMAEFRLVSLHCYFQCVPMDHVHLLHKDLRNVQLILMEYQSALKKGEIKRHF